MQAQDCLYSCPDRDLFLLFFNFSLRWLRGYSIFQTGKNKLIKILLVTSHIFRVVKLLIFLSVLSFLVYSPDMPSRLPIQDIFAGLVTSIGTAIRYWFHYTLVAFAWLGVVPLTACKYITLCIYDWEIKGE